MLNSDSVIQKSFQQLDLEELYGILSLRLEVFCVEQNCPYQDIDNQDQKAQHVFIKNEDKIIAYARIIHKSKDKAAIGRVVVDQQHRKKGLAQKIMKHCINDLKPTNTIELSAQSYLQQFYKDLGFSSTGEYYLEDAIPHEKMQLNLHQEI